MSRLSVHDDTAEKASPVLASPTMIETPPAVHVVLLGPVLIVFVIALFLLARGAPPLIMGARVTIMIALVVSAYRGGRIARAILAGGVIASGAFAVVGAFVGSPKRSGGLVIIAGFLIYCGVALLRSGQVRTHLERRRAAI